MTQQQTMVDYYNIYSPQMKYCFQGRLQEVLESVSDRDLIFLCIGTDRATGDCLGPFVGQILTQQFEAQKKSCKSSLQLYVYGTLSNPVHALNLNTIIHAIYHNHDHPFIIAIDASLGSHKHINHATFRLGKLYPGIGTGKHLPSVGDASITGIVNCPCGDNQNITLQTTRLHVVVELASFIANGIIQAVHNV